MSVRGPELFRELAKRIADSADTSGEIGSAQEAIDVEGIGNWLETWDGLDLIFGWATASALVQLLETEIKRRGLYG